MTRQEAIIKCLDTMKNNKIQLCDIPVNQLVKMLEALGLIKFEEEKKDNGAANCIGFSFQQLKAYSGNDLTGVGKAIISDLEKSGYKIIKDRSILTPNNYCV